MFRKSSVMLAAGVAAVILAGCGSNSSAHPSPAPSRGTPAATSPPATLACAVRARPRHPHAGTRVAIRVRTVPGARVAVDVIYRSRHVTRSRRANAAGAVTVRVPAGSGGPAGVGAGVTRHGHHGDCRTTFTARRRPVAAAAPTATAPPAHAPVSACTPMTPAGNCYRAGEFCPAADHGTTGADADGNPITCLDNDGWRWESS